MGALGIALSLAQFIPQLVDMVEKVITEIDDSHPAASIGDNLVTQLKSAKVTASSLEAAAAKP